MCVGIVPKEGFKDLTNGYFLYAEAMGRGTHFRGKINKCGIIIQKLGKTPKRIFGFQNVDIVTADVPKGKYKGKHTGRVSTRASGYFDIKTTEGERVTVNYKTCKLKQYGNGYRYSYKRTPLGDSSR